jgi:Zn finger protein HypA/HybF involved in hydrogenase expression
MNGKAICSQCGKVFDKNKSEHHVCFECQLREKNIREDRKMMWHHLKVKDYRNNKDSIAETYQWFVLSND